MSAMVRKEGSATRVCDQSIPPTCAHHLVKHSYMNQYICIQSRGCFPITRLFYTRAIERFTGYMHECFTRWWTQVGR